MRIETTKIKKFSIWLGAWDALGTFFTQALANTMLIYGYGVDIFLQP